MFWDMERAVREFGFAVRSGEAHRLVRMEWPIRQEGNGGVNNQNAERLERERRVPAKTDWLSRARSLLPLVEAEVQSCEQMRTLSEPLVNAFKETELFWMLCPSEVGGGGCGIRDLIEVIAELAWADCSASWTLTANVTSTAAAAAFCGDSAADVMFGGKTRAIGAGMFGPSGKSIQVPGGYQAGGGFSFGSGCAHASWFGGGMLVMEEGKPRPVAQGKGPEVRVCFVPREKVRVLDNWDVRGLIATGSFDYEIPEQFVAEDFTLERQSVVPRRGHALFKMGLMPIIASVHAAMVLGMMKRSLNEIARIVDGKKRVGYSGVIGDYPTFMHEFSLHEASYMAARDYVLTVYEEAEAAVTAGGTVSEYQRARFRQVATWVHKVGADVVRFAYLWSGSEGYRGSSAIGRMFRDTFVATQHIYVDPITLVDSAPGILKHYRPTGVASR
jgi:indole-3-acetate monooxygenase